MESRELDTERQIIGYGFEKGDFLAPILATFDGEDIDHSDEARRFLDHHGNRRLRRIHAVAEIVRLNPRRVMLSIGSDDWYALLASQTGNALTKEKRKGAHRTGIQSDGRPEPQCVRRFIVEEHRTSIAARRVGNYSHREIKQIDRFLDRGHRSTDLMQRTELRDLCIDRILDRCPTRLTGKSSLIPFRDGGERRPGSQRNGSVANISKVVENPAQRGDRPRHRFIKRESRELGVVPELLELSPQVQRTEIRVARLLIDCHPKSKEKLRDDALQCWHFALLGEQYTVPGASARCWIDVTVGRSWNSRIDRQPSTTDPVEPPPTERQSKRARNSGLLARLLGAGPARPRTDRTPVRGIVMLVLGLLLALSSAVADAYLHRGIETSASPPYVIQVSGRGLATNIDLREYPAAQVEAVAATMRANGFQFVRHPFYWSEIEQEPGAYVWETYDAIVRSFDDAGLEMVAVISGTPDWARAPEQTGFVDAPPVEPAVFADFVAQLVSRYGQYIRFFQIGDQPNNPEQWGGAIASAADYLEVLAPASNAAKTANQESKVILAEFSPTGAGTIPGADLSFLRAVYAAGGKPYFDVIAARIDGGTASPFDRRISAQTLSLSRAVLFREAIHENGDDTKPIWFTHYGWDGLNSVSRETQADYLTAGIERMRAEWPWAGLAFQWALRPDTVPEQERGLALLDENGSAYPAFEAIAKLAANGVGKIAATGFVPTDSGPIDYAGSWASQHLQGRVFQTTSQTGASLTITFEGTGLVAYLRRGPEAGLIRASIDGRPLPNWPAEDGKSVIDLEFFTAQDIDVSLVSGLDIGVHQLVLELSSEGSMTVGGMVVSRDPPLRWPVVLALVSALTLIFLAVRDLVLYLGRFSSVIRQVDEQDSSPRLPTLPDWRPSLRT